MKQIDIVNFLKEQFESGDKHWFTSSEILEGLKSQGLKGGEGQIHVRLMKLAQFQLIDFKGKGFWEHKKLFRYK